MTSGTVRTVAAISRAACVVRSSELPSGMFRMIWNSLLLSKGSIFTFTQLMPTVAIEPSSNTVMPMRNVQRQKVVWIIGPITRR